MSGPSDIPLVWSPLRYLHTSVSVRTIRPRPFLHAYRPFNFATSLLSEQSLLSSTETGSRHTSDTHTGQCGPSRASPTRVLVLKQPRANDCIAGSRRHTSGTATRIGQQIRASSNASFGSLSIHVTLRHHFVSLPNCLIDDRLRDFVPRLRAAVVTDFHWNRDTTDKVPFVCPLLECDLSIALDQAANLAKNTAPAVIWREHDPQQSGRNYAGSFARFWWAKCELFHIWHGKMTAEASWSAAAASKQRALTGTACSCRLTWLGIEHAVKRAPSLARHLRSPPRFGWSP